MDASGRPLGLALGGGAARGWAHVGVLRALEEANCRVTHIAGTSIGAVVGAFAATGRVSYLTEHVATFGALRFLRLFDTGWSGGGLVAGRRVEAFLREALGDVRIEDLAVPYAAIAVDLRTGQVVVLDRGPLVAAVRASIAIPGVFAPVESGGRLLADGGLADPVPVGVVRRLGATTVVGVGLNRDVQAKMAGRDRSEVPLPHEGTTAVGRLWRRIRGHRHENLLQVANAALVIIEQHLTEARLARDPADLFIQPDLAAMGLFDFHHAPAAIEAGYQAARTALADWQK